MKSHKLAPLRHRRTRSLRGLIGIFLSLGLALPSPVYALRAPEPAEAAGLEQLKNALRALRRLVEPFLPGTPGRSDETTALPPPAPLTIEMKEVDEATQLNFVAFRLLTRVQEEREQFEMALKQILKEGEWRVLFEAGSASEEKILDDLFYILFDARAVPLEESTDRYRRGPTSAGHAPHENLRVLPFVTQAVLRELAETEPGLRHPSVLAAELSEAGKGSSNSLGLTALIERVYEVLEISAAGMEQLTPDQITHRIDVMAQVTQLLVERSMDARLPPSEFSPTILDEIPSIFRQEGTQFEDLRGSLRRGGFYVPDVINGLRDLIRGDMGLLKVAAALFYVMRDSYPPDYDLPDDEELLDSTIEWLQMEEARMMRGARTGQPQTESPYAGWRAVSNEDMRDLIQRAKTPVGLMPAAGMGEVQFFNGLTEARTGQVAPDEWILAGVVKAGMEESRAVVALPDEGALGISRLLIHEYLPQLTFAGLETVTLPANPDEAASFVSQLQPPLRDTDLILLPLGEVSAGMEQAYRSATDQTPIVVVSAQTLKEMTSRVLAALSRIALNLKDQVLRISTEAWTQRATYRDRVLSIYY